MKKTLIAALVGLLVGCGGGGPDHVSEFTTDNGMTIRCETNYNSAGSADTTNCTEVASQTTGPNQPPVMTNPGPAPTPIAYSKK